MNNIENRRSPERVMYESNGAASMEVAAGIRRRALAILEGGRLDDSRIFSRSAAAYLQDVFGEVAVRKGVLTILNQTDSSSRRPFAARDRDGIFQFQTVHDGELVALEKFPLVFIPLPPGDPTEVQRKANEGNLPFEYGSSRIMALAVYRNGQWSETFYPPVGVTEFEPVSDRYGQAIFGGNRAIKLPDGRIALLRPQEHAERFASNAAELHIPGITPEMVMETYKTLARENREYLPDAGKGSLYFSPQVRASQNKIGVGPADEYLFTCETIPVCKIYDKPLDVKIERQYHRAVSGGQGHIKGVGNYAPTFRAKAQARQEGFHDVVFLNESNTEFRELSSSNIFFIRKDGVLVTPSAEGEILPGITRISVLKIAEELMEAGIIKGVEIRPVGIYELDDMVEVFSTGTGVTINAIKELNDKGTVHTMDISSDGVGPKTRAILDVFNEILAGKRMGDPRYKDWLTVVE